MRRTGIHFIAIVAVILGLLSVSTSCSRSDRKTPLPVKAETPQTAASSPSPQAGLQHPRPADWANEPAPESAGSIRRQLQTTESSSASKPMPGPVSGYAKTAYLTFDDGPSANTEKILSVLQRYDVKATFFVIGAPTEAGRRLYKEIAANGHVLGNHTFTHDYRKVYRSVESFRLDVEKLNSLLEESTGRRPDLLRFPGGSNNHQARKIGGGRIMPAVAAEMMKEGYAIFDWNVSSTDAARAVQTREEILSAVLTSAKNKKNIIVLMHDADVKTTTVEALPDVIRGLREQGFHFDVLRKDSFTTRFLKP